MLESCIIHHHHIIQATQYQENILLLREKRLDPINFVSMIVECCWCFATTRDIQISLGYWRCRLLAFLVSLEFFSVLVSLDVYVKAKQT
jgi:hypothetical protein